MNKSIISNDVRVMWLFYVTGTRDEYNDSTAHVSSNAAYGMSCIKYLVNYNIVYLSIHNCFVQMDLN